MEKLLSTTKKQGGKYAGTLKAGLKKNISYSYGSYRKYFFANAHTNNPKDNLFQDVLS